MTRRRKIVFVILSVVLSFIGATAVLLALDLYVHAKFDDYVGRSGISGTNIWGYRGPVVGTKQAGEHRIVVVGGSTAFGYGVTPTEAFPAVLEELLNQGRDLTDGKVSVVNLGYNNEGAHSFRFTLKDYEYLDYDAVLFYSGYNNLSDLNTSVFRHNSPVFRLTGYLPLLPVVMREKALSLRHGGDVNAADLAEKTVFKLNLVDRAAATALETATSISDSLERQLTERLPESESVFTDLGQMAPSCSHWRKYCGEMAEAVKFVLDRDKLALVVTQPYRSERHREQQTLLGAFLREQFRRAPKLHFANLGPTLNVFDPEITGDTLHLTPLGNRQLAQHLVERVRALFQ